MTLNTLTRQAAEEATDVMSPLKQECASQEARALPVSPTAIGSQRPAVCREV